MSDDRPSAYAPRDLSSDPDCYGFVTTTVRNEAGSCVARHRRTHRSSVATVLIHGAAGAWTGWTPVLDTAEEMGRSLQNPVVVDLPGWGDASLTADLDSVTIDTICDLVGLLLDELGYSRWRLVGHSLGGFVALHLATRHPDRVESVAMVSGTTFSVIRSVEHPWRGLRELPAFTMLWRVMQALGALGRVGGALVAGADRIGLLRVVFAPLFAHGWRVPRSLVHATAIDLKPRAFVAAAEVVRGYDARAAWSTIGCPVRALRGDSDVFVTDADLRELERTVPDCSTATITDCGHFALVERPTETIEFLELGISAPR